MPEIVDYEVRRELLRADLKNSLIYLDQIIFNTQYLEISSGVIRDAAEIWADVRRRGLPTAGDEDLDIDAILAAQARSIRAHEVVIATSNVKHLSRYFRAEDWQSILP